ncbi:MAG TPA: DNA polymerase IV [Syntrophomonadaceae bacterium]|nr:DNA polymerase IV [Syntrophomonadaceae bacterium]
MFGDGIMDILHCDLDAFFASVEQRDQPELKGKPVIIGAPPNSRGVVSTCSYEARVFGVRSAMPSSQAYRLCPQAIFLPPDMKRYREASQQVFAILAEYTPIIEALSIDEAFLDVSASHAIFGSSMEIGIQIRHRVKTELGLNISVGIGANKFLAKLATNLCKPDGIMEFTEDMVTNLLPTLPVDHLWGIGAVSTRHLNRSGIYTVQDLLEAPRQLLKTLLGSNTDFVLDLARGVDNRPVTPYEEVKSIGNELTFPQDISDQQVIEQVLLELAEKVAHRLRIAQRKCQTVTVKLRTPDFQTFSRSITSPTAIDDQRSIFDTAWMLYQHSGLEGKPLRLVGLTASRLQDGRYEQPSLFSDPGQDIDSIIYRLNEKFTQGTIKRAVLINPVGHNIDQDTVGPKPTK